jgi:hypothetical protein
VDKIQVARNNEIALEFGGLRLEVYYTNNFGASVRVFGLVEGTNVEMLRFDDFVDTPHYHAPASDPIQIDLNPSEVGEPREFFLAYLAQELPTTLQKIGFAATIETLDLAEIKRQLPVVRAAMDTVLVDGFFRADGKCLQDSDLTRPQLRDEANARFAARIQAAQAEAAAQAASADK